MASYYFLQVGMSRGIDSAEKKSCRWRREYFYLEAGMLASVNECEDGLMWRSPAARFGVPQGAVPCLASDYDAALARWQEKEDKRLTEEAKQKEFSKSLKKGMARHAHASHEADAAELLPNLAQSTTHFLDDFTVFDTETTGLNAEKDRILELAAVRYQHWQEVGRLQLFVRFTGPIPYYITKLTGITSREVCRAPEAKVVLGQFRKLAGESLLVGHNVSFDLRMIEAERARLGAVALLPNPSFCTLELAKRRTSAPHKLGALCERFGIPVVGAHRALNDVLMTYQLLKHLHQQQSISAEELSTKRLSATKKTTRQPSLFAA